MKESDTLSIRYMDGTKGKLPRLPFRIVEEVKDAVLGPAYELSLVFCDPKMIRKLNLIYRNKNKPTDILSFSLDKKSGEIFICPDIALKKIADYGVAKNKIVLYLLIHGLFHLKGLTHGSTMERKERTIRAKFNIEAS